MIETDVLTVAVSEPLGDDVMEAPALEDTLAVLLAVGDDVTEAVLDGEDVVDGV